MKVVIACLVGLVLSVGAEAEPVVEGQVWLIDQQPVAGASVLLFDLADLGRGVVARARTDASGQFVLSLGALGGRGLPQGFALGQNYPNPFNPATVIPYQLRMAAHVQLDVFNMLGQRVATLVDGAQAAGFHSVVWDATDRFGRSVAAGVYLYRLRVDGAVQQSKRMVLVDGQAGRALPGAGVGPLAPAVAPVAAVDGAYGLVIGGAGIVPYVDAAFEVGSDMGRVEFVVESAGSARGAMLARPVLGDVTGDGRVNRADALVVMTHSLDASVGALPAGAMHLGDVTGDGRVNRADATAILGYAVDPLDGSLPPGIGKVVASGKRVGEAGAQGIGVASTMFGAIAAALADAQSQALEDDYKQNRKWLGYLRGGIGTKGATLLDATLCIDLADYMGITPEGKGSGDDGEQWVTVWIDFSGGAKVSLPVEAGAFALDFESNAPDPKRQGFQLSIAGFSGATFSANVLEWGVSDDVWQAGVINTTSENQFVMGSAFLGSLEVRLIRFELKKSFLDLLISYMTEDYTAAANILIEENFGDKFGGLIKSLVDIDSETALLTLKKDLSYFRQFTSSDSGEYYEIDGYFNGVYSNLGHVGDAPVANGDTLFVAFENTGNSVGNFRVEAEELTEGWRIDSLRPEDLSLTGIFNLNLWQSEVDDVNVSPGQHGGTAWQIFADTHAPEVGWIRFTLYHDKFLFEDVLLDQIEVPVQRSPHLGDLSRVADLRMQRMQVRRNGYFLFSLSEPGEVRFTLSGLSGDANLFVVGSQDGQVIGSSTHEGLADDEVGLSLTAGTYYIRVWVRSYDSSGVLHYELRYSNSTAPRGGDIASDDSPVDGDGGGGGTSGQTSDESGGGGGGGTSGQERTFTLPVRAGYDPISMAFVWIEPGCFRWVRRNRSEAIVIGAIMKGRCMRWRLVVGFGWVSMRLRRVSGKR